MRSLHVDPARSWRGGERQVLLQVSELVARGHDCLVAGDPRGELVRRCRAAGLRTLPARIHGDGDPAGVLTLAGGIRRFRPHLLHLHTARAHAAGGIAGRLTRCRPILVTRRLELPPRGGVLGRWKYARLADHYIAISTAVKESLLSGGVPAERITQIASGIPVGEVSTRESERTRGAEVVVGTVAAFTPQKAPSVWVDTVRRVAEACPGARFIWAGEGPLLEECRTRIREYGLAGRVDFPGFVEAVDSVWEKIDIFFLPSAFEALGTVFLDAMARGIPVVATRVGGIGEVVRTDREGILTEAGDDAALAAGIERLVADRVLRKDMGEQGKIRAREFDIGKIVDRLEALYQELTTGSAREVAS